MRLAVESRPFDLENYSHIEGVVCALTLSSQSSGLRASGANSMQSPSFKSFNHSQSPSITNVNSFGGSSEYVMVRVSPSALQVPFPSSVTNEPSSLKSIIISSPSYQSPTSEGASSSSPRQPTREPSSIVRVSKIAIFLMFGGVCGRLIFYLFNTSFP